MRPTKVLDEDTSEPKSHSEKTISLSEIYNYRISLSTHRIRTSKNSSALKELSSKNSHKVLSQTDVLIREDSSDKIIKQLFEDLKTNED